MSDQIFEDLSEDIEELFDNIESVSTNMYNYSIQNLMTKFNLFLDKYQQMKTTVESHFRARRLDQTDYNELKDWLDRMGDALGILQLNIDDLRERIRRANITPRSQVKDYRKDGEEKTG
jgi:septation ring formation regulator EzrA